MDLMIAKFLGFFLVLSRISAFFLVMPVFSWASIPVRVKVAIAVLLSLFFSIACPVGIEASSVRLVELVLLMCNEALHGVALGLIASCLFSAVKVGGRIAERQMGLAMAEVLDPLTGERSQPLGSLLEMIFIVLFLSANGHHLLLMTIWRSYAAFPVGTTAEVGGLAGGVIKASSVMLLAGLRLTAPMLAAFLLLLVTLAILARIVPEMNILFISLPLRVGLGLLMAAIFLPLVSKFVGEFSDWLGKLTPF